MSQITRSWLSLAAIGSGIVHLALVVSSPLPLAIPLLLLGLAEVTWGIAILAKDRLLLPRSAQIGAIAPVLLWSLLVASATLLDATAIASSIRVIPMAIATVFELFIGGMLSAHLRRRRDGVEAAKPKPASAGKYLSAMLVAGLLVGMLTTPALAATQAGTVAMEHGGTMGGMMMDMGGH